MVYRPRPTACLVSAHCARPVTLTIHLATGVIPSCTPCRHALPPWSLPPGTLVLEAPTFENALRAIRGLRSFDDEAEALVHAQVAAQVTAGPGAIVQFE